MKPLDRPPALTLNEKGAIGMACFIGVQTAFLTMHVIEDKDLHATARNAAELIANGARAPLGEIIVSKTGRQIIIDKVAKSSTGKTCVVASRPGSESSTIFECAKPKPQ
jgi:hypothetical protein